MSIVTENIVARSAPTTAAAKPPTGRLLVDPYSGRVRSIGYYETDVKGTCSMVKLESGATVISVPPRCLVLLAVPGVAR